MKSLSRKIPFLVLSAVVLAADQISKLWAMRSLKPVGSIEVIPDFFRFSYAVNRGVAFSLFADSSIDLRWVLAGVSIIAASMVIGYLIRTSPGQLRMNTSLGLLLAGIIGNLIDRVRMGEVVDFLDFHWAERYTWPTFNVADAAICCGAILLALELLRDEATTRREKLPPSSTDNPTVPPDETKLASD